MRRAAAQKVTCEECFFRRHGLCALGQNEACVSFRPYDPDALRPPQQLRFEFRQERRTRTAWAFPSAQEQAERYGHELVPTGGPAPVYGLPAPDPEHAPCQSDSQFSAKAPRGRTAAAPVPGISHALASFAS